MPKVSSRTPSPTRSRDVSRVAVAGVGILLALVTLLLLRSDSLPGASIARASYDLTLRLRPAPDLGVAGASQVLLVLLDRRTFDELGRDPSEPLDRALHAQLVRRLHAAGAAMIAFDILFDRPGATAAADQEFAEALRAHGNVLLGAEWHRSEFRPQGASTAIRGLVLPATNLLSAAAGYGFAFSRVDPDFVVRRHFPGFPDRDLPSLTWQAAVRLGAPVTQHPASASIPRWLNYYGPPLTIPNVSFIDALDPSATPDAVFRGKVVLVGTRPTAGRFDERRDEWRSPLEAWGRGLPFMPAVEVHATELLNLLRQDWLRRPDAGWEAVGLALSALAIALLLGGLRPAHASAAVVVLLVLAALSAGLLARDRHLWFPWLIVAAIQVPGAAAASFVLHTVEWYRLRREFQARIREQAALLDKAQDAIVLMDLDGAVTYANPRARKLYGWGDTPIEAARARRSLDGGVGGQLGDGLRAALSAGEWMGELGQVNAAGEPIVVQSRATLIRDERGRPREVLFINTDVTERKRLQEQFLRAQRRETLGALAGGMAHDLNNALSPILMGIQTLKSRATDDTARRMLDLMETSTRRGAGMVRQVLLFSRGQDSAAVPIQPAEMLRELEAVLRQSFPREIAISVLAPPDLWPLVGNPTQLHQILLNLCLNARDAMPGGGLLTLAADNAELSPDELADLPDLKPGRHVMLLVSDTGTGMPPEVRARLFEPFFTTKQPGVGTGLGLATVASLVKAHAGALRVRSQVGEGTAFEVYLPAATATEEPQAVCKVENTRPPGRGERILVVDDELSIRELIRESLGAQGYDVRIAGSGIEALAAAREQAGALKLVITDWRITDYANRNVAVLLREAYPDLPLIVVSGAQLDGGVIPSLPGAPVPVLAKPFRLEDLLGKVVEALDRLSA